ncbi:hypothetical protein IAD21_01418 [Abditibacteriota bacterium]|nr:hypothetical protein IAD21_01418 [Abditibacteriota bacterium]
MWAFSDEVNQAEKQQVLGKDNKIRLQTVQVAKDAIVIQEAASGRSLLSLPGIGPQSLAFSPDGKKLAIGSYRETGVNSGRPWENIDSSQPVLMLWDVTTGKKLWSQLASTSPSGNTLAFSPDGTLLARSGLIGQYGDIRVVQLWNAATGKLQRTLKSSGSKPLNPITSLVFSLDGKNLIGRNTTGIFFWDVQTGTQQRMIPFQDRDVSELAISPDGQTLAAETSQFTIRLWDLQSGRLKRELVGHSGGIVSLAFSPDSQSLVSGSWDGTTKIWNVATGRLRATLMRLPESRGTKMTTPNWIAFTPDGYYQSSPGALAWIRWRVGDKLYPSEVYKGQERSDLLP